MKPLVGVAGVLNPKYAAVVGAAPAGAGAPKPNETAGATGEPKSKPPVGMAGALNSNCAPIVRAAPAGAGALKPADGAAAGVVALPLNVNSVPGVVATAAAGGAALPK